MHGDQCVVLMCAVFSDVLQVHHHQHTRVHNDRTAPLHHDCTASLHANSRLASWWGVLHKDTSCMCQPMAAVLWPLIHKGSVCHVSHEWHNKMFAVWSDKCTTGSINVCCTVCSVQCVVWNVQVQVNVHVHVQVQCVVWSVQCAQCTLQFSVCCLHTN